MKIVLAIGAVAVSLAASLAAPVLAQQPAANLVPVTVENFVRAESDFYMSAVALKENGFGRFQHHRELSPIDVQLELDGAALSPA
jgi:hypothetical protein